MGRGSLFAFTRASDVAVGGRGRACGQLLAIAVCLLVMGAAAPGGAHAASFEKGFWGPTQVDGVSQFPTYDDLGVTLFQMTVNWDGVAPTRPRNARDPADPAYRWPADVDYAIREAKARGMKVLLMLIQAPT